MSERFIVSHGPTDKPGGSGSPEQPNTKKRNIFGKALKSFTKEGRRTLRQERGAEQRAKEAREHLSEPEHLRRRLKEFDAALYYVKAPDKPTAQDEAILALISILYKKARKIKLPKAGAEKAAAENALAEEARQYIFTGLIPRGEEIIDALPEDEKKKKSKNDLQHMREINDRTVRRHIRKYLEWRWAESEWNKDWNEWQKSQGNKKEVPQAEVSASIPKWDDQLSTWVRVRRQQKLSKQLHVEPRRPPAPPQTALVITMAKRLGEDHLNWRVNPIKPEVAN